MSRDTIQFSLTDENSHSVRVEAGQGSFSIGPAGDRDAIVRTDETINWNAFDGMTVPAGGHWPRVFRYVGNDTGFAEWSVTREIEEFDWTPTVDTELDLSRANIGRFFVSLNGVTCRLKVGRCRMLSITGDLDGLDISLGGDVPIPRLHFSPRPVGDRATLPPLPRFADATSVHVSVDPLGAPFDCESLQQFRHLIDIQLSGNLCNSSALIALPDIESIAIRYAPDLVDFPGLDAWPMLNAFIAWNVEKESAKRLRKDLNRLKKVREFEYSTVSKLRERSWFVSEYGLPFSAWTKKNTRVGVKAYKTAVADIASASTKAQVKKAVVGFIETINTLPDIETSEREDVARGVVQLTTASTLSIDETDALNWFDSVRDF